MHPRQQKLSEVRNFESDYADLVNFIQRHTKCNHRYSLKMKKDKQT